MGIGMTNYYLAVDIGASSGRHMLAHMEQGRMVLEEVYRFSNGMTEQEGTLCWDVVQLFTEIKNGMKQCAGLGKIPVSMGIDTWAVDFVLLDARDQIVGQTVGYRDDRTRDMDQAVYERISEEALYTRTGIQKQSFNSIYQLMAVKKRHPEQLQRAQTMLLIPDYFHFLLTGKKAVEYTNATTTQLVSPVTKDWDYELIDQLGYPRPLFLQIQKPGTVLGKLTAEIQEEVGFSCQVVLPATHDTGSAVMAIPSEQKQTVYISSGTWSLMGTELTKANCTEAGRKYNFTNEGGYNYRFRYLKNIMGLWMIQSVKREIAGDRSFGEISELASKEEITSVVDCNADRFLAPQNMTKEVQEACAESGQQVPCGIAQVAAVIYHSLAECYAKTMREIEAVTGESYAGIHIVGGGANADYLNQLTAEKTGLPVYAGPTEATAIGNLAAQMIAGGEMADLQSARKYIKDSFAIKEYTSTGCSEWRL